LPTYWIGGAYRDGNLEFAENQSWHSDQGKAL